jgi:hypothetical protein
MTGWFDSRETLVGMYAERRSTVVNVELYMEPSADGDIPSAVVYFLRNGFDADYPGSLDPETGHCWGFTTSIYN